MLNIQHPDITAMERTGYPRNHGRKVEIEITNEIIKSYIGEDKTEFIDFCILEGDIVEKYIEETRALFEEWCQEVLGGQVKY